MMAIVTQDKLGVAGIGCDDRPRVGSGGRLSRDSAGAKFGGERVAAECLLRTEKAVSEGSGSAPPKWVSQRDHGD